MSSTALIPCRVLNLEYGWRAERTRPDGSVGAVTRRGLRGEIIEVSEKEAARGEGLGALERVEQPKPRRGRTPKQKDTDTPADLLEEAGE